MKIYKNKKGDLTIVYGVNEEPGGIRLVKDRGPGRITNFFGNELQRFLYHWTGINAGHTSQTAKLTNLLNDDDKRYKLVRSKQK